MNCEISPLCSNMLQWHHISAMAFSNDQQINCSFNKIFSLKTMRSWKLCITDLLWGKSSGFPSQMASIAESVPYHDIIIPLINTVQQTNPILSSRMSVHLSHSHLVLMYDVIVWFSACPLIFMYIREVTQVPDVPVVAVRNGRRWCIWMIIQVYIIKLNFDTI